MLEHRLIPRAPPGAPRHSSAPDPARGRARSGTLRPVDLRRVRHGEWIAGVSGAVLLVALFLDWYSSDGGASANGWESFTVTDVLLAVAALFGIALAVGAATQRSPAVPQAVGQLTVPVALVAAVAVVIQALSRPVGADNRELGLYLGTAAALGVLVGS